MPCRFEVVETQKERRIPEVHSCQYGPPVKHAFDIYYPEDFLPETDEPLPFVVNIHGGGWGALDKINSNCVRGGSLRFHKDAAGRMPGSPRLLPKFLPPAREAPPVTTPLRAWVEGWFQQHTRGRRHSFSRESMGTLSDCQECLTDPISDPRITVGASFRRLRISTDTTPPERHSSAQKDQARTTDFMKHWGLLRPADIGSSFKHSKTLAMFGVYY